MVKAFPLQYERGKAQKAFDDLLLTREQEMKQLATDISYPSSGSNWQEKVLLFCLDVDLCYIDMSKNVMGDDEEHKCMLLMQRMAKGKPLIELQKVQDLAYNIAEDFKSLYAKQD
ncbi:MAG: hypothetical protein ACRD99_06055 [Nitrososphaera sp.]